MNRPFDEARYASLLKGLDATVIKFSKVHLDNEKFRLDDGYFSKLAVLTLQRVEKLPHVRFGEATSVFRKGIFDIKADSYLPSGIPFVRIGDLKNGLIDTNGIAFISATAHQKEAKTGLRFGDMVLSKTAIPAASFVTLDECNVSQDTIAVRIAPAWKKRLRGGFVTAFLNSRHGLALMEREFQGNVQAHLSLPDGKKIPIPLFDMRLQDATHSGFIYASKKFSEAAQQFERAEQALLRELGLNNWRPPEPLTYTANSSQVFAAGRFDAEYFNPAKHIVIHALAAMPHRTLGEHVLSVRDMFVAGNPKEIGLVRNFDLGDALDPVLDDSMEPVPATEIGSSKKRFRKGDVVISRLRSYLREIAIVRTTDDIPSIGSSEFIVLRPKFAGQTQISPTLLWAYLHSQPVQTILKSCVDGSQHPRFSEIDLLSIPVPDAIHSVSAEIEKLVDEAISSRILANRVLSDSKRAIEIAIDDSEEAALLFLASTTE